MTRRGAGPLLPAAAASAVLSLGVFLAAGGWQASPAAPAPSQPVAPKTLPPAPLAFEATRDQGYRTRGAGYDLFVDSAGSQLVMRGKPGSTLRTRVLGARAGARAHADGKLPTVVNRYSGADRNGWREGIPTFGRVTYRDVYRGIDLRYHGRDGRLEYDFVLEPGTDPRRIALGLDGARSVRLARGGDLLADVGGTTLRQHAPITYQRIGGRRVTVASRFVVDGTRVRFHVGDYDRARTLVIDPTLVFGDYVGGGGADNGGRIAVDSAGNMYLAATSASAAIPGSATVKRAKSTGRDAFVMKVNPSGAREWITYLGATGDDQSTDIAVDGSNRPYVVGQTTSTGFPTAGASIFQANNQGGERDGFVTGLNADGSLRWSTYYGTADADTTGQIAVTPSGHVYVPVNAHELSASAAVPPMRGYLYVWDSTGAYSGNAFQYDTANDDDTVDAVATLPGCDATNCQAYITGHTLTADPDGPNPMMRTGYLYRWNFATGTSVWFTEFSQPTDNNQDGTLEWPGGEWPVAVATDPGGNAVVTGTTKVDTHSWMFLYRFAKEVDGTGVIIDTPFIQFSVPPLNGDSFAGDVATDAQGNVYTIGTTLATNGSGQDGVQPRSGGAYDAAVVKYFPDGPPVRVDPNNPTASHPNARIVWATFLGGADNDLGLGIATDGQGGTYVSGEAGSSFLPSPATQPLGAAPDAFIAKIQTNGASVNEGPSGTVRARDVTFKYSSGETGGRYECRLITPASTPAFADCNGTSEFKGLADGSYTFEIKSWDRGATPGPDASRAFTIDGRAVATFTMSPNPVLVGGSVKFDGSASVSSSALTKFEWDLDGDGTFETNTGTTATTTQIYPAAGSFNVGLRITDAEGKTATTSGELKVNAASGTGTQFGVTINNGAQYTRTPDVTVTSNFPTFTSSLLFSNDGGFGNAKAFPAQKLTKWQLESSGPERLPKTLYVRFLAGSVPSQTYQDDIILDETPPRVDQASVTPAAAASSTARAAARKRARARRFVVKTRARDSNSGVSHLQATANKRKPGKALRYKKRLRVKATKRPRWVRARDRADNWSKWKKAR